MPDLSHPDPRPPAADGERALPEEIVKAIEAYDASVRGMDFHVYRGTREGCAKAKAECRAARAALTTSILSRLTVAEAGREEAEKERDAWKDQAESWQATAQDEAEIGNERRSEADAVRARVEKLETALTWYVENDDVNLNDPGNEFWIDGYNRARALLTEAQPKGDQ